MISSDSSEERGHLTPPLLHPPPPLFFFFLGRGRRSLDGDRVLRELGPRVSRVIARRRQALVEARQGGAPLEGDAESAEFELGLWSEWENITAPPQ